MTVESDTHNHLLDLSHLIFLGVCTISFAIALVYALEIPIKLALIFGLVPIGVVIVIVLCLSFRFKVSPKVWKNNLETVARNDKYTEVIKSVLFPVLLLILYFYIRGEDGQEFLYTISPVDCDMTMHVCGSSYHRYNTEEVWDAADLTSQLSHDEVFIITNTASEKHQTRGICPQTGAHCSSTNINPGRKGPKWLETTSWTFAHEFSRATNIWNPVTCQRPETSSCDLGVLYDNGIQTDSCEKDLLCNVVGWCPLIKLDDFSREPTFQTENFTLFLDLKPNFPAFRSPSWTNGGQNGYSANYAHIYAKRYGYKKSVATCVYDPNDDPYCPRFTLKHIVTLAEEENEETTDFAEIAAYGGQFKIEADWTCRFDWGKDIYDCFPIFRFYNQATNKGKPKIVPKITSQNMNNRTITYSMGINVSISHVGNGQQIQFINVLLYAQFIYISFAMIKGPLLWISRCLIAIYLMTCQ